MTTEADFTVGDFPPPTISTWLSRGAVSTERLVRELREWADYMERMIPEEPDLPDDLKALVGVLPDDEIRLILRKREGRVDLVAVAPMVTENPDIVQIPANVDKSGQPPCTKPRSGGVHSPARYFLQEDKTVDGQCACGVLLQNVKCPHRHQRLNKRTKAVECEWCGGVIIAGTGTSEPTMDLNSLRFVDPRRFEGTVT